MGDVFSDRNNAKGGGGVKVGAAGDYDELPTLSKLLCGVPLSNGKGWEVPPHSLTCFVEGSIVKCVIGAGDDEPKYFGTISSLASGFLGVEKSLTTGNGEWKPPKSSGRTWRR